MTDHDHITGNIRGILCSNCNLLLGKLGDNYETAQELCRMFLSYLEGKK